METGDFFKLKKQVLHNKQEASLSNPFDEIKQSGK